MANLVENAIVYTGEGGRVGVVCSGDRSSSSVVVSDTGIGIEAGSLDHVFERFWRADSNRKANGGSGLGLSIARALARRHGGDIAVTSRLGAGSTFVVKLPSRPPDV